MRHFPILLSRIVPPMPCLPEATLRFDIYRKFLVTFTSLLAKYIEGARVKAYESTMRLQCKARECCYTKREKQAMVPEEKVSENLWSIGRVRCRSCLGRGNLF